ncbi:hypothetical protein EKG38_20730 [Shewanella canadensis]|uniref:Uncharacterized protein n=1 Tax=Shewanella canadensis TaxID=271096 RepID=A0A3S0IK94_9GAMM|nr:cytochrome c3 family protein [Shewanella canadensis]RTR37119.1 hypothetical protein EKG38_20730 [Shewanella canadensis]
MKPMTMMLFAALSATSLSGCGGSDKGETEKPVTPPIGDINRPQENVFGAQPKYTMVGKSFNFYWNEKDGMIFFEGGAEFNPPQSEPIDISGDEVLRWLDENHGGESIKNQYVKMFKPGVFTEFDVLAYVTENRKAEICQRWEKPSNCEVNFTYNWSEDRRSFDYAINGESNWLAVQDYSGGIEDPVLELVTASRPDEVIVKNKMSMGVYPYPIDEVELYQEAQRQEIERLNKNGGKVIIPATFVQTGMKHYKGINFYQKYIKVYAGSMWAPSEYTDDIDEAQLDDNGRPMYHTGYDDEEGNFVGLGISGLLYWDYTPDYMIPNVEVTAHNLRPDLYYDGVITMADFVLSLNDINGHSGDLIKWPTLDTGSEVDTYAVNGIDGLYSSGFYGWNYNWTHSMIHDAFQTSPWDSSPHIVADSAILASPDLLVFQYANFYESYYEVQKFIQGDKNDPYVNTRKAVLDPMSPLTSAHFGWKVADCSMCHSTQDMDYGSHNGLNTDELLEPAKCAECHGNNGAPKGHDQKAGCYRCHFDMVGHADAIEVNGSSHPFEKDGIRVSKVMPDPYACVSCHYNENDILVGGK